MGTLEVTADSALMGKISCENNSAESEASHESIVWSAVYFSSHWANFHGSKESTD